MRLSAKIPREVSLACSGGPDSMGALWFLSQVPNRLKNIVFIHHGTVFSDKCEKFVKRVCTDLSIPIIVFNIEDPGKNAEAIWHEKRDEIFQNNKYPIVTAHHLDDQVEQYLLTTIKCGKFKPIYPSNKNIIRPFLFMTKGKLIEFADRLGLGHLEDPTNYDIRRQRAYVRNVLVNNIRNDLGVELRTVVRKKTEEIF